jgi:hypothetical protein
VSQPFFEGEDDPEPERPLLAQLSFGILAVVALFAGLCLIGFLAYRYRPTVGPHARQQARLAGNDAIWDAVPASMSELRRWTDLGDAAWMPWDNTVTSVGRTYTSDVSGQEALDAWTRAAVSSGWRSTGPGCNPRQLAARFHRGDGRWPAVLDLTAGADGRFVRILIRLPSSEINEPSSCQ